MALNQYYTWAAGSGANALTNSAFYALTTLRASGFQPGIASSEQVNTVLRQTATVSAAVGSLVAYYGLDALDNGNAESLRDSIIAAIRAAARVLVPVGTVITSYRTSPPEGYLLADGGVHLRSAYSELYSAASADGLVVSASAWGTDRAKFSSGDGVSTFQVPDLRGVHIRALDSGRGLDPFRTMASYQADQVLEHTHTYRKGTSTAVGQTAGGGDLNMARVWDDNAPTGLVGGGTTGAVENRVKNVALAVYIKY